MFDGRSCRIYDDVRDSKIHWDIRSDYDRKIDSSNNGRVFPRTYEEDDNIRFRRVGLESQRVFPRFTVGECSSYEQKGEYASITSSNEEVESWLLDYMKKEAPFLGVYRKNTESESIILRFKRNLSSFNGFWHTDDLLSWVDDIEDFFSEVKPPRHLKCKIVWYKMEGAAYYWWKQLQDDRKLHGKEEIISWPRMKNLLLSRFVPIKCSTECPVKVEVCSEVVKCEHNVSEVSMKQIDGHSEEKSEEVKHEVADKLLHTDCLMKCPSENSPVEEEAKGTSDENEEVASDESFTIEHSKESVVENNLKTEIFTPVSCSTEILLESDINKHVEEDEFRSLRLSKLNCRYTSRIECSEKAESWEPTIRGNTSYFQPGSKPPCLELLGCLDLQQSKAKAIPVKEVLGAAQGIYKEHISELQRGIYQQLPVPGIMALDDCGQLIGANLMMRICHVLVSNLLVAYRIILVGMLSFMFDPGGKRRSQLNKYIKQRQLELMAYYVNSMHLKSFGVLCPELESMTNKCLALNFNPGENHNINNKGRTYRISQTEIIFDGGVTSAFAKSRTGVKRSIAIMITSNNEDLREFTDAKNSGRRRIDVQTVIRIIELYNFDVLADENGGIVAYLGGTSLQLGIGAYNYLPEVIRQSVWHLKLFWNEFQLPSMHDNGMNNRTETFTLLYNLKSIVEKLSLRVSCEYVVWLCVRVARSRYQCVTAGVDAFNVQYVDNSNFSGNGTFCLTLHLAIHGDRFNDEDHNRIWYQSLCDKDDNDLTRSVEFVSLLFDPGGRAEPHNFRDHLSSSYDMLFGKPFSTLLSFYYLSKVHIMYTVSSLDPDDSPWGLNTYSYHDPSIFSRKETNNEFILVKMSHLGVGAQSKSKYRVESLLPIVTISALMLDEIIMDKLFYGVGKFDGLCQELTEFAAPQPLYLGPTVNVLLSFDPGGTIYLPKIQKSVSQLCLDACTLFVFTMIAISKDLVIEHSGITMLDIPEYTTMGSVLLHENDIVRITNLLQSGQHILRQEFIYVCTLLESTHFFKCNLQTGIDFNLTRGRVIALEGWNDEHSSDSEREFTLIKQNVVTFSPCLGCLKVPCKVARVKLFCKMVNGLDPPIYMRVKLDGGGRES